MKGVVLEGFPREKDHIEEFNKQVGGLSRLVIVDCGEEYMKTHMTAGQEAELEHYRMNTLPVLGYYDDLHKVTVVGGTCIFS